MNPGALAPGARIPGDAARAGDRRTVLPPRPTRCDPARIRGRHRGRRGLPLDQVPAPLPGDHRRRGDGRRGRGGDRGLRAARPGPGAGDLVGAIGPVRRRSATRFASPRSTGSRWSSSPTRRPPCANRTATWLPWGGEYVRAMRRPLAVAAAIAIAATLAAGALASTGQAARRTGPRPAAGDQRRRRAQGPRRARRADRRQGSRRADRRKGPDTLAGGPGRDGFNMRHGAQMPAPGRDKIYARDGEPDEINCGAGDDVAYRRRVEDGVYDCENVRRRSLVAAPGRPQLELARGELADARARRGARRGRAPTRSCAGATSSPAPRRWPALAGMASLLPTETLVAAGGQAAPARRFPKPAQPADRHLRRADDGEPLLRPLLRLAPERRRQNAGLTYPDARRHATFPTHRLTPDFQGCDFRDPDHGWDGGRCQYDGGKLDGFYSGNAAGTGSDEYALGYYLEEDLRSSRTRRGAYTLYDRYFCSIMASTYPNRHYQWRRAERGAEVNVLAAGAGGFQWETIFDRASPAASAPRYYSRPAVAGALRQPRAATGCARSAVLRRRRRRQAAANHLRRSAVPRRRRGRRHLGRRAPARRRPPRPGVHVRRRARVHGVAAVPARRAVRQLRRVGRLLRPRHAPPRARRPRRTRRPAEDWASPASGSPASRSARSAEKQRCQPPARHPRVDPEADLLPLRARPPQQAPPLRVATSGAASTSRTRNFDPPALPDPPAIAAIPCSPAAARAPSRTI